MQIGISRFRPSIDLMLPGNLEKTKLSTQPHFFRPPTSTIHQKQQSAKSAKLSKRQLSKRQICRTTKPTNRINPKKPVSQSQWLIPAPPIVEMRMISPGYSQPQNLAAPYKGNYTKKPESPKTDKPGVAESNRKFVRISICPPFFSCKSTNILKREMS